jgi:large subunit ribosomal protein L4
MVNKRETGRKKDAENSAAAYISAGDLGLNESAKKDVSPVAFAIAVRSLLQNWRQGTVACKSRCDVISRSNKKPWKQKGTGRARAGSPRSPVWRGGGVSFGPQPRVRSLAIPKKMRKNVLNAVFFNFLENNKIVCLDWQPEGELPKTSAIYGILQNADLVNRKLVVFVPVDDAFTVASCANIAGVRILSFDQPNVVDLADGDYWVFFRKDLERFREMVQPWI